MPRRNLRNGTLLAVSEAAKLVNVPIAHDVVHHIRKMAATLKPSVLQAPKENDTSARELADCVIQLVDVLDQALEYMGNVGYIGTDGPYRLLGRLAELRELRDHLARVHSELQDIQDSRYSTKFASQSQFRNRLLELKEELWQYNIRISACTHAILIHFHHATARAQQDTRHALNQQIRTLDRKCQSLRLEVNAMHAVRQIDEQKIGNLILMNWMYYYRAPLPPSVSEGLV